MLWKVTPLFADWITYSKNPLWTSGLLSKCSSVLELGCGISGLVGLALAPLISRFILTDQLYVSKWVEQNLQENNQSAKSFRTSAKGKKGKSQAGSHLNVSFTPLDWELDEVTTSLTGSEGVKSFDAIIACDCIYNEALIKPLVQTCVDACRLRQNEPESRDEHPTICVVAQQRRDPEIFESWLKEFHLHFRTWRVPESALTDELKTNHGFVIHIGILRRDNQ